MLFVDVGKRHTGKVGPGIHMCDLEPRTLHLEPFTWDLEPRTHRQNPGPGTFTWDPDLAAFTWGLSPVIWDPICGRYYIETYLQTSAD